MEGGLFMGAVHVATRHWPAGSAPCMPEKPGSALPLSVALFPTFDFRLGLAVHGCGGHRSVYNADPKRETRRQHVGESAAASGVRFDRTAGVGPRVGTRPASSRGGSTEQTAPSLAYLIANSCTTGAQNGRRE